MRGFVFVAYSHNIFIIEIDFVLFHKATFKGWMDIMYAAVDSRNVSVSLQCS